MNPCRLWGVALLALTGAAQAQEQPAPATCAGLATDSFEAAVLGCDQGASVAEPRVPPRVLDRLGEAPPTEPARLPAVLRPSATGGLVAALEAGNLEVVQISAGSAGLPTIAGSPVAAGADPDVARLMGVPDGQRPPAGLCRVWFPRRHAGLQRAPTSCDTEVPEGAVLIRG